ncbi:hypothetical protein PENTCL1PPCAC_1889 [Pristionchus entomophagus]|uniref:SGNH hydrolase-type esterase domain-containing protein n=1 Tax=Pristionchus entomophagus TaxID=358040 RepID=A0AAV5SAI7_9BILA|nr:hypothetical protein PENTCL1PPCAC_1889 [Pristionchus entomophagus]
MFSLLSSFLYLFQLVNNWPRALIFIWDESVSIIIPPSPSSLLQSLFRLSEIEVIATRPPFNESLFANSLEDIRRDYGRVVVSICDDPSVNGDYNVTWTASLYSHTVKEWSTGECSTSFIAPHQGEFTISVQLDVDSQRLYGKSSIVVRDIWIAAVGDSFASGEGNPDEERGVNNSAKWISVPCHRSRKSWPYRIYDAVRRQHPEWSVHFSYLACTGATVERGVMGPRGRAQIDVLREIARERGVGPDVLMLSVGGNDVGYAEILERLQRGETESLLPFLDWRFYYVSTQLTALKEALQELQPAQVLVPLYFDFSRNERGEIDASCADMHNIRTADIALAERRVLSRLNSLILKTGKEAGWNVEERVPGVFSRGGICSKHRLIRSISDSISIQGDPLGAFHPTEIAHSQIADLFIAKLRPL